MLEVDVTPELRRIAAAMVEGAPEPPPMPVPAAVAPRRPRPLLWAAIGGLTVAAVVLVLVLMTQTGQGAPPHTLAVVQVPSLGASNGCGTVESHPATATEEARVTFVPGYVPPGYHQELEAPARRQERAVVSDGCWQADATYIDPDGGRILATTVSYQGGDTQPDCQVPADHKQAECITVQGREAHLFHQGERLQLQWITTDDSLASLGAYGITVDELIAVASTLRFDGASVSLTPPEGMIQVEDAMRRTDGRQVIYYQLFFARDGAADLGAESISLRISTWGDLSINEVGPTRIIDLNGVQAIAVSTGGPGTGIIDWEAARPGEDPRPIPAAAASRGYITWTDNGVDFRLEGPDLQALTRIARELHPAQ